MTDRTATRRLGAGFLQLAVALLVASYALPYIYLLMTSLKPAADVLQIPPRFLPETLSVDNYRAIFANPSVPSAFFNSLVVAVLSTGLALLLAVPAAYGASFFRTQLSAWFLLFALVTRMVPSVSLGVPLFVLLKNIGLLDTIPGLVLAHTTLSLPLAVWLMAAFFESIPRELEEAARMDGCTRLAAFWHIILPPASGGIAITALFSFIASWNEFLYALLLSAQNAKTAPIVIAQYKGAFGLDWGPMSALAMLYSLPVILITLILQKKIIGGLTFGAVKG